LLYSLGFSPYFLLNASFGAYKSYLYGAGFGFVLQIRRFNLGFLIHIARPPNSRMFLEFGGEKKPVFISMCYRQCYINIAIDAMGKVSMNLTFEFCDLNFKDLCWVQKVNVKY
jgi:hypothetical protein